MEDNSNFPLVAIRYLANLPCRCQSEHSDIQENKHYKTCMVGKAQNYLGIPTVEKYCYCDRYEDDV